MKKLIVFILVFSSFMVISLFMTTSAYADCASECSDYYYNDPDCASICSGWDCWIYVKNAIQKGTTCSQECLDNSIETHIWGKTCVVEAIQCYQVICGCQTCPSTTLIDLVYFNAIPSSNTVLLEWETDMEIDNAGFNIWLSEEVDGEYIKINQFLIPAQGSGSYYSFIDEDMTNGITYYYKLEDIDLYGVSTFHEPVSATPNEVVLLSPDNNAVLVSGTPPTFEWASDSYTLFKLVFEGHKLRKYSTKGWITDTTFTPSVNKWGSFVGELGEGQTVSWSVKGKDVEGNKAQSETRSFTVE